MDKQENLAFAKTKTGIRCMGETHWAEGETRAEAERNYYGMQQRWPHLQTKSNLLQKMLKRLK